MSEVKTLTVIYGGLEYDAYHTKKNKALWYDLEGFPNKVYRFSANRSTTGRPIGTVVDVATENDSFKFGESETKGSITELLSDTMIDAEQYLKEWSCRDASAKMERAMKISENKLAKELGDKWMDMTLREISNFVYYQAGVQKLNMIALVLRKMGL